MQHPLYAENEEEAIDNTLVEHRRREDEARRVQQRVEDEEKLSRSFPWVRRLWEEDKGERHWGYGIFVDPDAFADDEEAERYDFRQDGVLHYACGAIGLGSAISRMWRLQTLPWPTIATPEDDDEASSGPAADGARREGGEMEQEETDTKRAARFQTLREHFRSIRDRVPERQRQEEQATSGEPLMQAASGGLQEGILQNVFLVVDKRSAGSVLSKPGFVDDMWVWAVDPDHHHHDASDAPAAAAAQGLTSAEARGSSYAGFMRVRLQQLANNFYDARRFHGDGCPMARLWGAAQESRHQAFVSLRDDEARSWIMDRFLGSAMRSQPPRIVYGPKPGVAGPAGTGAS